MIKRIFLFSVLMACLTAAVSAQKKLVGNLKLKPGSGCSETFTFAGQSPFSPKQIFYSSAGDERETWMNIDGRDVRLRMISHSKPTKMDEGGGELVGSRTREKYVGRNVRAEIILTVSWLCAVDDPGCESIGFTAIFKVKKGKRRQIVKAEGVFGC